VSVAVRQLSNCLHLAVLVTLLVRVLHRGINMSIIDKLLYADVLSVGLDSDLKTIEFMEACDWYYGVRLNKREVSQLISELTLLHEQMKD